MALSLANRQALRELITDETIQDAPFEGLEKGVYPNLVKTLADTNLAIAQYQASPATYKAFRDEDLGAGVGAKVVQIRNAMETGIGLIEELHALNPALMPGLNVPVVAE